MYCAILAVLACSWPRLVTTSKFGLSSWKPAFQLDISYTFFLLQQTLTFHFPEGQTMTTVVCGVRIKAITPDGPVSPVNGNLSVFCHSGFSAGEWGYPV